MAITYHSTHAGLTAVTKRRQHNIPEFKFAVWMQAYDRPWICERWTKTLHIASTIRAELQATYPMAQIAIAPALAKAAGDVEPRSSIVQRSKKQTHREFGVSAPVATYDRRRVSQLLFENCTDEINVKHGDIPAEEAAQRIAARKAEIARIKAAAQ